MDSHGVRLEVYGQSDVGRVRHSNEDAFVIADLMRSAPIHAMSSPVKLEVGPRGVLLAVSDGMGGAQAMEVASAVTLHSLRRGMSTADPSSAEAALAASVKLASRAVSEAGTKANRKGMGATLAAMLIHGKRAFVAEVGHSRAYVLRDYRLIQLTGGRHSAELMLGAARLTREEPETFQYKNVILHAIGTKPHVTIALNRFLLRQYDRLLLCSDGLPDKVNSDEIRDAIAPSTRLDAACTRLVDLANSRGGEDNVTVVLAEMGGEALPAFAGKGLVSLEAVKAFHG